MLVLVSSPLSSNVELEMKDAVKDLWICRFLAFSSFKFIGARTRGYKHACLYTTALSFWSRSRTPQSRSSLAVETFTNPVHMPTLHADVACRARSILSIGIWIQNVLMNSDATDFLESDKISSCSFIDIMSSVQETMCIDRHCTHFSKPVHQNEAEVLRHSPGSTVLMNHSPNL